MREQREPMHPLLVQKLERPRGRQQERGQPQEREFQRACCKQPRQRQR
jgi:hypothetical protein